MITAIGEATIADADSLRRQMISAEPNKPLIVAYRRGDEEKKTEITPDSVAGAIFTGVPEAWTNDGGDDWITQEIKLPDAGNKAAYVAPKPDS